ncbi:MAG: LysR family transcriptional regulator [Fusobacteriaceae bacterium]
MDLDRLRYIITVGEERSFSKASKKLFISQPALSQYISGVENEMGCLLFDRKNIPLTLTPAGEIFIKRSKEIEDLTKNFAGTLTFGISPFRNAYILPKFIPELKKIFPNVKIKVIEKHAMELEKDLEKGVVDLIVTSLPLTSKEFDFIPFCKEETFIVTPKDTRFLNLARDGEIRIDDLRDENFILTY